jgi:hypothetical protein
MCTQLNLHTPHPLPPQSQAQVGSWLTVTPIKSILLAKEERLRYQLSFEPLKPTNTLVEFVVLRKSGGRSVWSHMYTRCIIHHAHYKRGKTRQAPCPRTRMLLTTFLC